MTLHGHSERVREWVADALDTLAVGLWRLAHWLRPRTHWKRGDDA